MIVPGKRYCLTTLFPDDNAYNITHAFLAYKAATSDLDTMYLHQARKAEYWPDF